MVLGWTLALLLARFQALWWRVESQLVGARALRLELLDLWASYQVLEVLTQYCQE